MDGDKESMDDDQISARRAHLDALEAMGFDRIEAEKGMLFGNGTVTGAIEWIVANKAGRGASQAHPSEDVTNEQSGRGQDGGERDEARGRQAKTPKNRDAAAGTTTTIADRSTVARGDGQATAKIMYGTESDFGATPAIAVASQGVEVQPIEERRPASLSYFGPPDEGAGKDRKMKGANRGHLENEPPPEPPFSGSPDSEYCEPSLLPLSSDVPDDVPAHQESMLAIHSPNTNVAPTAAIQIPREQSDRDLVVPTAYTVDERIVEAQNVLSEKELSNWMKRVSRKRRANTLAFALVLIAGVVLITLGTTGQFGPKGEGSGAANDTFLLLPPATVLRSCLGPNCWVQRGPDLRAEVKGDEFADVVSHASGLLVEGTTRIAVSAPESHAGGNDSGFCRVYDLINNSGGAPFWKQVGQEIVGLPGDEVVGYLSPNGLRLAVGAWLNDGKGVDQGSIGQVRVFELSDDEKWTLIGEPIYGENTNERFGRNVAFSFNGTTLVASARNGGSGFGVVRSYQEVDGEWVKRGRNLLGASRDSVFGNAVSMSHDGSIIGIGAQDHTSMNGYQSGLVRVFEFKAGDWNPLGNDLLGLNEGDNFGIMVHLAPTGRVLAVGSRGSSGVNGTQDGDMISIFSFDQESNSWTNIPIPFQGNSSDESISSFAFSSDMQRMAVGSSRINSSTGHVRAYQLYDGSWQQLGGTITGQMEREYFGSSVSLNDDGDKLVVGGAPADDLRLLGVVRVFELPWFQDIDDIVGLEIGGRFGDNVDLAMNGRRVAISAPRSSVTGKDTGSALILDITMNGSLVQVGKEVHGGDPGDEIIGYLSTNGRRLALGARWNNGVNGTQGGIGKVSMYELNSNGNWALIGDPIYGEASKDRAGKSVALNADGSLVAVASPLAAGRGQVRVFRYSNDKMSWVKLGSTLSGDAPDDQFGWHALFSADGSVLAVNARHNGGNGDRSGQVKVFEYNVSGNYTQIGEDIYGEAEGDSAGIGTSLSADGMTLAVSSPYNSENGASSGKVRVFVYKRDENKWLQIGNSIYGSSKNDELNRVSLTTNGKRLVTASHASNGNTGYVDVYDLISGKWQQVGGRIWGEKPGGQFGFSTDISEDGTRLAVGSPARNAEPAAKGFVRLYRLPPIG